MDKDFEGYGFAAEASKACINYAFKYLEVNKVVLICNEDNKRANRFAENTGAIPEGLLRHHTINQDGILVSLLCYGITRNDYERRNG